MSNKSTTERDTIADLKIAQVKIHYRYIIALSVFFALAVGLVCGYFLSIELITDSQQKAISVLQTTLK